MKIDVYVKIKLYAFLNKFCNLPMQIILSNGIKFKFIKFIQSTLIIEVLEFILHHVLSIGCIPETSDLALRTKGLAVDTLHLG